MKLFLAIFISFAISNPCSAEISLSGFQNLNTKFSGAVQSQGGERPGPDGIRLLKEEWHPYTNPNGTQSHGILRKYRIEKPEAYAQVQADHARRSDQWAGVYLGTFVGLIAGGASYVLATRGNVCKGMLTGFGTGAAVSLLFGYFAGKSTWNSTYGSSLMRARLSPEFETWEGKK